MTIKKTLQQSIIKLKKKKISSASLDAEVLLSHIIKKPKSHLYTYPEKNLTAKELKAFEQLITRRAKHEPVAYLTNSKEFFGLNFYVNKNVLITRPETEILTEEVISLTRSLKKQNTIIDIGTGSGCLAITFAKHLPQVKIYATDISKRALEVAKRNARQLKVAKKIKFYKSNLLKSIKNKINWLEGNFIITANLPYLTSSWYKKVSREVKYEPKGALMANSAGLEYYQKLFKQINDFLLAKLVKNSRLFVILEIDPRQKEKIKKLISQSFPRAKIKIKKDLAGLDRTVVILF